MSIGLVVSIKGKGNSLCISDKTKICPFVHIIIIIIPRPGANTTKYNHQRDNLLMGHVQTVHGQHSVCRSCRKDAQEMIHMHTYTVKGV